MESSYEIDYDLLSSMDFYDDIADLEYMAGVHAHVGQAETRATYANVRRLLVLAKLLLSKDETLDAATLSTVLSQTQKLKGKV